MKVSRIVLAFLCLFLFQPPSNIYSVDTPPAFQIGALGLHTDILQLKDAYPNSSHTLMEGSYVDSHRVFLKYPDSLGNGVVNPGFQDGTPRRVKTGQYELRIYGSDVKDHVYLANIEIDNDRVQAVRLNFEKPESDLAGRPQLGSVYPACDDMVKELISKYGQPTRQATREVEASTNKTVHWANADSKMRLECTRQGKSSYQAYEAEITRKVK